MALGQCLTTTLLCLPSFSASFPPTSSSDYLPSEKKQTGALPFNWDISSEQAQVM